MAPFGSWGVHTLIRPSLPHKGGGVGWDGGTKHRGVVACQGFLGSCCPDSLLELETKRTLDVEINSFPNKNWYVLGENFTPNKFAAIYKQSGSGIPKLLLHKYLKLKTTNHNQILLMFNLNGLGMFSATSLLPWDTENLPLPSGDCCPTSHCDGNLRWIHWTSSPRTCLSFLHVRMTEWLHGGAVPSIWAMFELSKKSASRLLLASYMNILVLYIYIIIYYYILY